MRARAPEESTRMFQVVDTALPGLKVLQPRIFKDARGDFVKTYHAGLFRELGLPFAPAEEFFSVSRKDVVRGMHFQTPPHAHAKLVYCVAGRVLDVVVDLRRDSPTRGQYVSRELSAENREMFFIPEGFAHGFLSLEDDTVMVYQTSTVHAPEADAGIHWRSVGFAWPIANPVVSERDEAFPTLAGFDSPF
jgi:dTDP-4-dehydrorhamnose 3,5-epimerase